MPRLASKGCGAFALGVALALAAVTPGAAAQAQQGQPPRGRSRQAQSHQEQQQQEQPQQAQLDDAATARARELYTEGQRHFQADRFAEAEASFRAAYELVPSPVVLLAIASAQERQQRLLDAARSLRRYLRERPDAPDRATIEQRIASLDPSGATAEPTLGTVRVVSVPEGAAIAVDGADTGRTTPAELQLATGEHTITLTLAGHVGASETVSVGAGTTSEVEMTLTAEPAHVEEDVLGTAAGDETEGEHAAGAAGEGDAGAGVEPSVAVWVTTAIAGVGLVTGTVFGFLALSAQSDFDAMPTHDTADRGETFALIADLAFGVALATGVSAIVLYVVERPRTETERSTALRRPRGGERQGIRFGLAPWGGLHGGGGTLSLSF